MQVVIREGITDKGWAGGDASLGEVFDDKNIHRDVDHIAVFQTHCLVSPRKPVAISLPSSP